MSELAQRPAVLLTEVDLDLEDVFESPAPRAFPQMFRDGSRAFLCLSSCKLLTLRPLFAGPPLISGRSQKPSFARASS